MVKVQYTFEAKDDLKNIYSFIALDSSFHAKRFIKALKLHTGILKSHPEIGSLVYPGTFKNLRVLKYKSYRIIYHFSPDITTIITIHHHSRLLENIPAVMGHQE